MNSENIERYILKEMTNEELAKFDQALLSNENLRNEVERMKFLIDQLEILAQSEKIRKAQKKIKKTTYQSKIIILVIFGCLLSLILVLLFYSHKKRISSHSIPQKYEINNSPDPQFQPFQDSAKIYLIDSINNSKTKKFVKNKQPKFVQENSIPSFGNFRDIAEHYYYSPEEFSTMRDLNSFSKFDSVKLFFNNENYEKALNLISTIEDGENQILFFKALIYFKMNQFQEADKIFSTLLDSKTTVNDEILWYSLLNNLACGEICKLKLKKQLEELSSNSNFTYYKIKLNY
jgi:hypothetical protein